MAAGVELADEAISVLFADADGGFACTGIVNKVAGGARFVDKGPGASFWEIRFTRQGADKTAAVNNLATAAERTCMRTGNGLLFCWKGVDLPDEKGMLDVEAAVELDPSVPGRTCWRLKTRCRSARWAAVETRYPSFKKVVRNGEADVMMPAKSLGAKLVKAYDASRKGESFPYPCWYPMVAAYFKGDAALYLAAHDPGQRCKTLLFRQHQGFEFLKVCEEAGRPGLADADVPYPVVVQAYRGDWWKAAKTYREWALRQKWARKGPKLTRKDYPRRMAEAHGSFLAECESASVSNYIKNVCCGRFAGVKGILEWTKWQYVPHDCNYPELLPPRPGVKDVGEYALSAGMPVMPYTNGRLWSTSLASFRYAADDAVRRADGSNHIEHYGKYDFAVMCPASTNWQDILVDRTLRTVEATGAGAIYLDQIACSAPRICHDVRHGHPCGGGSWWADGYRAALSRIHDKLAPQNIPVTSEGAGDAWLDVIDGYLLASDPEPGDLPFYAAVYSDYATYFGTWLFPAGMEFPKFFTYFSRAALWGVETGWVSWITFKKYAKYGEVFLAAMKLREENAAFLAYGELTGERRFAAAPSVYATTWRSADGRTCTALANSADAPVTVDVDGTPVTVPAWGFAAHSAAPPRE